MHVARKIFIFAWAAVPLAVCVLLNFAQLDTEKVLNSN